MYLTQNNSGGGGGGGGERYITTQDILSNRANNMVLMWTNFLTEHRICGHLGYMVYSHSHIWKNTPALKGYNLL